MVVLLSALFFAYKVGQILYVGSTRSDDNLERRYEVIGQSRWKCSMSRPILVVTETFTAPRHTMRHLFVGSTTTEMLRKSTVPLLLLR